MSVDLVQSKVSVATTGIMTVTNRIYLNKILAATFSAVTGGQAYPTVTVGAGNAYVEVVLVVTPDTPVTQAAAETEKYIGSYANPSSEGVLGS